MKSKVTYILITSLVVFWIGFIGWGMLKTTAKLSKQAATPPTLQKTALPSLPGATAPQPAKTTQPQGKTEGAPTESRLVLVRTSRLKTTNFEDILPVMGTVKGKTEMGIKFEIGGVIRTIYFHEGEPIKQGEIIACIDPKDAQLKVAYAKSKYNAAASGLASLQKKLEVHQQLFDAGAIIKSKLEEVQLETESAKSQVETTQSELQLAENELEKTCIYAPRNGLMGPREAEEGEFITPQDKIGTLLETSEVFVEVGVVERDISKIKLGLSAKVYVDAHPNVTFEGIIDKIFPVIEGKSRTLTVKIKIQNPKSLLMPGMFARAEIAVAQLKDAIMVPSVALIQAGPGITLVPVISEVSIRKGEDESQTGIVELRKVKLGYLTTDYAQVLEGLKASDLVVIETQGELKDNIKVKIVGIEDINI